MSPEGSQRSVILDEDTYYDLRDLAEEIEDQRDVLESDQNAENGVLYLEQSMVLLERAGDILQELMWRYEESSGHEDPNG